MKRYIKPTTELFKIGMTAVMAGSGVRTGDSVVDEYESEDVTYGKDDDTTPIPFSIWDE